MKMLSTQNFKKIGEIDFQLFPKMAESSLYSFCCAKSQYNARVTLSTLLLIVHDLLSAFHSPKTYLYSIFANI